MIYHGAILFKKSPKNTSKTFRSEYGSSGSTAENSECGAAGFVGSLGFAISG